MKLEPNIPHQQIKETLKIHYGINVVNMKFIPLGMCSWSYHIYAQNNQEYFLKLLEKNSITSCTEESLQTLHVLRTKFNIDQLPFQIQLSVLKNNLLFLFHLYYLMLFLICQKNKGI